MARFDDETLAKIKSETDIVALIESYGAKLKPRGSSGEKTKVSGTFSG